MLVAGARPRAGRFEFENKQIHRSISFPSLGSRFQCFARRPPLVATTPRSQQVDAKVGFGFVDIFISLHGRCESYLWDMEGRAGDCSLCKYCTFVFGIKKAEEREKNYVCRLKDPASYFWSTLGVGLKDTAPDFLCCCQLVEFSCLAQFLIVKILFISQFNVCMIFMGATACSPSIFSHILLCLCGSSIDICLRD